MGWANKKERKRNEQKTGMGAVACLPRSLLALKLQRRQAVSAMAGGNLSPEFLEKD